MLEATGEISEDSVYNFTGNPSPAALQHYQNILLNKDVSTAFI